MANEAESNHSKPRGFRLVMSGAKAEFHATPIKSTATIIAMAVPVIAAITIVATAIWTVFEWVVCAMWCIAIPIYAIILHKSWQKPYPWLEQRGQIALAIALLTMYTAMGACLGTYYFAVEVARIQGAQLAADTLGFEESGVELSQIPISGKAGRFVQLHFERPQLIMADLYLLLALGGTIILITNLWRFVQIILVILGTLNGMAESLSTEGDSKEQSG